MRDESYGRMRDVAIIFLWVFVPLGVAQLTVVGPRLAEERERDRLEVAELQRRVELRRRELVDSLTATADWLGRAANEAECQCCLEGGPR